MTRATGRPQPGRQDRSSEAGFSLLELLIASLVSVLVVGGVLVMLDGLQQVHRDSQELIDAQQTTRLCLEQMQRDLQLAGVGLAWLLPPTPLVVPRADGGIDIRLNQGGLTAVLTADMAGPTDPLQVDDVTGFEAGMLIAVYDAAGAIDMVTIVSVDTVNSQLLHDGASKAYTVANGTAVARILTISYMVQNVGGVQTLMRQEGGAAGQPIGANILDFDITYWDDSTPPVAFNPITAADQLRIHTIQIDLEVETENVKLNTNQRRSVTLTTRITPRAVVLS